MRKPRLPRADGVLVLCCIPTICDKMQIYFFQPEKSFVWVLTNKVNCDTILYYKQGILYMIPDIVGFQTFS